MLLHERNTEAVLQNQRFVDETSDLLNRNLNRILTFSIYLKVCKTIFLEILSSGLRKKLQKYI